MELLAYSIAIVTPVIIYMLVMCLSGVISTKGEIKEYFVAIDETINLKIRLNECAKNVRTYGINLDDVVAFDKLATSHLENPVF